MKHNLTVKFTSYGHWKISTKHYNNEISCTTTNSQAIDDFNSDPKEKEGRTKKMLRGYNQLRKEIIRKHS